MLKKIGDDTLVFRGQFLYAKKQENGTWQLRYTQSRAKAHNLFVAAEFRGERVAFDNGEIEHFEEVPGYEGYYIAKTQDDAILFTQNGNLVHVFSLYREHEMDAFFEYVAKNPEDFMNNKISAKEIYVDKRVKNGILAAHKEFYANEIKKHYTEKEVILLQDWYHVEKSKLQAACAKNYKLYYQNFVKVERRIELSEQRVRCLQCGDHSQEKEKEIAAEMRK